MVEISASMVKELREKTGAGMMDCKKALVETLGDLDKAFEHLRQKGIASASKKADRPAAEGLVVAATNSDQTLGLLLEVNCETDFVARNEHFKELTDTLTKCILETKVTDVDSLMTQSFEGQSIKDLISSYIAKTGENIVVKRFHLMKTPSTSSIVGTYVHSLGGKMGALITLEADKAIAGLEHMANLGREIAMHVVSSKPQFLAKTDVPSDLVENERRIESNKADLADKKPEIKQKIIDGRVDKIMAERCLLEQPFVKDPSLSVGKYLDEQSKTHSTKLNVTNYVFFLLGQ